MIRVTKRRANGGRREHSPRMLQNEMEKSLGAILVAAVEILLVLS